MVETVIGFGHLMEVLASLGLVKCPYGIGNSMCFPMGSVSMKSLSTWVHDDPLYSSRCMGIVPVNTSLYFTSNCHYTAPEYHLLAEFSVPL